MKYKALKVIEIQKPNVRSAFIFKTKIYAEEGDCIECKASPGLSDTFAIVNLSKESLTVIADKYEVDLLIKHNYLKEVR